MKTLLKVTLVALFVASTALCFAGPGRGGHHGGRGGHHGGHGGRGGHHGNSGIRLATDIVNLVGTSLFTARTIIDPYVVSPAPVVYSPAVTVAPVSTVVPVYYQSYPVAPRIYSAPVYRHHPGPAYIGQGYRRGPQPGPYRGNVHVIHTR